MTVRAYSSITLIGLFAAAPAIAGHQTTPIVHGSAAPRITRFRRGLSGFPISITAGPRRTLWFTEGLQPNLRGAVGRISTSGKIREFHRGITGRMYAESAPIVMGSDKDLWFAETSNGGGPQPASIIGRITPSGKVRTFRKGVTGTVNDLTRGPDGNVWFTESVCSGGCRNTRPAVGRITPSGAVTTFSKGLHKAVFGITTGPDGNLWAVETGDIFKSTGGLARITPTGEVTEFGMSSSINNTDIITGPDGRLWFSNGARIGTATPPPPGALPGTGLTGLHSYNIGKPSGFVHALTVGPKKTIWFGAQVEQGFAKVGKLTTNGRVTRLPQKLGSTRGSFLDGIARGPDGNIWVTEAGRASVSSIDRVKLR